MSSQRQNSAFKPTRVEASELLRQKRVLTRDDSGIFSSSPSPLTPSRTISVFPPPDSTPSEAMSVSDNTAYCGLPGRSSPTTAGKMAQTNGSQDGVTFGGREMQTPPTEELYFAFRCRASNGTERWAYCSHTHCTNIRNQWHHLNVCTKKPCDECQNFQRLVLCHAVHCHDDNCVVTLCQDAKDKLRMFQLPSAPVTKKTLPIFGRSNSFSTTSKKPEHFKKNQGSFDDMSVSPTSPEDYLKSLRELNEIGVGALPRHLRTSYSRKAEQIVRKMEMEDELTPPVENLHPPAPPSSEQFTNYPGPTVALSPIEEHPATPVVDDSFPSQTVLYRLHPNVLTQGLDGRYLQRRDYDLNEHLGSGGFGTCAAARDYKTDKLFVIKSNKFDDDKMVDALRSECNILSKIPEHENITKFLGAVLEEKYMPEGQLRHCRLMMELAEHGSLAGMLLNDEGGSDPLPLDQSLYYMQQILQGVYHLHSCNIVHLDIKAENVLVLEGGRRVKLTDFGTAAHIDEIAATWSKLIGHTPHFSAPEIIRGETPSFSCDIWSTSCVLIQLISARLPGCWRQMMTRENMQYMVGNYTDSDIEKLIPLSEIPDLAEDVGSIFYDTLRKDPRERPSALKLLGYPALVDACEYEQYFDIECIQVSEQEESGTSMEGTESYHTPPTSLPHLIVGPGEDSDVSLDMPIKAKKMSQDSGVSRGYDRTISEVFSVMEINDDSGVDTPGPENYPPLYRQLNVHGMNPSEAMIVEDKEGEEQQTSIPDRSQSYPETSKHVSLNQHRPRSMSATYQRPIPAREGVGPQFGRTYPDENETFLSLPAMIPTDWAGLSPKPRPTFVHLTHSNSAPVMMSEEVRSRNQNEVPRRIRRSSSEVYVDRGPDIDTPEEKKKKELALAKQAEEQIVAMAAAGTTRSSEPSSTSSNHSQRNHPPSLTQPSAREPDHSTTYHHRYPARQTVRSTAGHPAQHTQIRLQGGGYVQETLV